MCQKTPLYDFHVEHGGKMVPFAGWWLPVQYETGVIKEHQAVREACGVFDVSHMGEIMLSGPHALACVQHLLTNDMAGMEDGRVRYSPMCNEQGGVVDDLVACKLNEEQYLLVVNASNKDKDVAWMQAHNPHGAAIEDVSAQWAQLALQGPRAKEILQKLADEQQLPQKNYTFVPKVTVGGINCLVSRSGYTGEFGYELYCRPQDVRPLMEKLLADGQELGLICCGLGARDTLRLEAAMPLYGHEMNDDITPLETGLGMFVKLEKPDFVGKAALLQKGEPTIARIGLEVVDRGIVREHCGVYAGEEKVGQTTSGTFCPHLQKAVAMALVDKAYAADGQALSVDVRGRRLAVKAVPLPFYKRAK